MIKGNQWNLRNFFCNVQKSIFGNVHHVLTYIKTGNLIVVYVTPLAVLKVINILTLIHQELSKTFL